MKRKTLYLLLGLEFAALLALALLTDRLPALFSSLLAFPFEQAGAGLRALSLAGRVGNGLALALWAGVSMLPLIPALRHRGDRSRRNEDSALILLSIALFFVLCGMANPVVFTSVFPDLGDGVLPVMKAIMGGMVWSVVVLWAVLRLLRLFRAGDTDTLLGYLRTLLYALCALFTGVMALSCGGGLIKGLGDTQRALDGFVAALRFLASALPYGLDIAVTLSALELLDALLSPERSGAAERADRLSRLCCLALGLTAAATAGMNLLQLALAQWLSSVAVSVDIPLASLAFVLAALLLSRLIAENRRLQSDNDLFI